MRKFESGVSLEMAFDRFCREGGIHMEGNYWDHLVGYRKVSLDYPGRMLFIKYEDMMNDVIPCVTRLVEYVGCPFSAEEVDSGVVPRIVEMCSFGSLSQLEVNKSGKHRETISNSVYFRKGKVGDWSNYLTPEMTNKIDQITLQKLANTGL